MFILLIEFRLKDFLGDCKCIWVVFFCIQRGLLNQKVEPWDELVYGYAQGRGEGAIYYFNSTY